MSCNPKPPTPLVELVDSLEALSGGGWVEESFSVFDARDDVRKLEAEQATVAEQLRADEDALAKLPCDGTQETRRAFHLLAGDVTSARLKLARLAMDEAFLRAEVERQEWLALWSEAKAERDVREDEARGEKSVF